jgi:hypothetical protein
MVAEVSGDMRGESTPGGSRPDISARRSATPWRAMKMSAESSNTTVMTDRPGMDSELMRSTCAMPLSAPSSGRVTRVSICSGASPGASVCTNTVGGTNSGSTS